MRTVPESVTTDKSSTLINQTVIPYHVQGGSWEADVFF